MSSVNADGAPLDISVPLGPGLPTWPASTPFSLTPTQQIAEGADANVTALALDSHSGTHLDAPLHGIADGEAIGALALERVVGVAFVATIDSGAGQIGAAELNAAGIPHDTARLLLRTANSASPIYERPFTGDYAALSLDGARWVADRGIGLIGIDYLSIQSIADTFDTHRVLFGAGTWILEGLDLSAVEAGRWELCCLPLSVPAAEAAPARAILRPLR